MWEAWPPQRRAELALARMGKMRLKQLGLWRQNEVAEAQFMVSHPNFSGFQQDQVTQPGHGAAGSSTTPSRGFSGSYLCSARYSSRMAPGSTHTATTTLSLKASWSFTAESAGSVSYW